MAALEEPAMEPDFSLLYAELKLPPDCSLEEFKCAYRRRISELHPDRNGNEPASPEAQAELAALISTNVAVNRFHSRYGRMPGGSLRSTPDRTARTGKPASRSGLPIAIPGGDDSQQPARPTWRIVVVFIALVLLLASWDWLLLGS